jgi:CDP-4-dehydro-6-deoxyglucose reductase
VLASRHSTWEGREENCQYNGRSHLSEKPPQAFRVRIEPGGVEILVSPDENVLAAALAAGIPLAHSCRGGRCGSCKSKLLSGSIEYPAGAPPPGITAAEIARGEVLLCQARPRSDLRIEAWRLAVRTAAAASCEILSIDPLPLGALRLRLRILAGSVAVRPGQFVDVRNHAGDTERLAVTACGAEELELEAADDGSVLRRWLGEHAVPGLSLRIAGPFDRPRGGEVS